MLQNFSAKSSRGLLLYESKKALERSRYRSANISKYTTTFLIKVQFSFHLVFPLYVLSIFSLSLPF